MLRRIKRILGRRRGELELVLLHLVSFVPVHRVRAALVRWCGGQVDRSAVLSHGFQIRAAGRLVIGARSNIGERAVLDARGGLTIGADVNFSSEVQVWTAQHDWNSSDFAYVKAGVVIGDRAWLGPRVIILPGTHIGEGAVVAAGAVAKGHLKAFTLYGGVPAREIASRDAALTYELPDARRKSLWW